MPDNLTPGGTGQPARLSFHSGIPVREDTAFRDRKGNEKSGIRRRVEKAIEKLQEPLLKFLEPGEAVLFVAAGQVMPSAVERLFLGAYAYYLAPATLVLTDRRLLHLLVTWNGRWGKSLRTAPWNDIEKVKAQGFLSSNLRVRYRGGEEEVYWRIRSSDAKKIQQLAETLVPAAAGDDAPRPIPMRNLCPECRAVLQADAYECPNCRLNFKDPQTMLRRALAIPGGGFFYTGHTLIGVLHALVDVLLLFYLVISVLVVTGVIGSVPNAGSASPPRAATLILVFVIAAFLVIHKWIMIRISRRLVRNYLPAS